MRIFFQSLNKGVVQEKAEYFSTFTVLAICASVKLANTFWISGSGNILSANNFQRLNKGVVQEK